MYLVTEGKYRINQLGYSIKNKEYVYYHKGKEIWRMIGDRDLFDYFNKVRAGYNFDESLIENNPVWIRYSQDCNKLAKED